MYNYQQALQQAAGVAAANMQRKQFDVENDQLAAQHYQTEQSIVTGAVGPVAGTMVAKSLGGLTKRYVGPLVGDIAEKLASGDLKGGLETGVQAGIDTLSRTLRNRSGASRGGGLDLTDVQQDEPTFPSALPSQSDLTIEEPLEAPGPASTGDPFVDLRNTVTDYRQEIGVTDPVPELGVGTENRVASMSTQYEPQPSQLDPNDLKSDGPGGDFEPVDASMAPEAEADAAVSDVVKGTEIARTLTSAAETDAALGGPEDPIGDVVSLAIGLGGLFGSIFGVHKPSLPKSPQIAPLNPSSQFGV